MVGVQNILKVTVLLLGPSISKLEVSKERRKRVGFGVRFVSYSLVYGLLSGFPLGTCHRAAHVARCNSDNIHFVSLFLSVL